MSSKHFIEYGGRGFCAYDVAKGVLLKHVVDVAERRVPDPGDAWLVEACRSWRIGAVLYGLCIDESWSPAQMEIFIDLIRQACDVLKTRESIPGEEVAAWPIIDDLRIFPRGAKEVHTAPVVELGEAIVDLIQGTLPESPVGTWWCFGFPDGRTTIRMRESTPAADDLPPPRLA